MSFYGSSFSFDGVSCEEYGLMMYDFDSHTQGNSKYASGMKIMEDRLPMLNRSLFYGAYYEEPLEFTLVFGADEDTAANDVPIDRQDVEVIGSWLTGHNEYKWLVIDQPDMEGLRYRCIITDLETIEVGMCKWAFQCTVHCDSPYAYTLPKIEQYVVDGERDVVLHSRSSANNPYYPEIVISLDGSNSFSITNLSDNNRSTEFTDLPQTTDTIRVSGDTGVVSAESGLNMYQNFNFVFPRLVRGDNHLKIMGQGTILFICSFPVNIGG